MKKTLITAGLIASMSLVAVACDNEEATPEPTTPAEAVESMAAEDAADVVDAVESMAAEDAADVQDAVESMVAEESPAA